MPIFLLYGKRGMPWSINWMPRTTAAAVNRLEPDVVNLHWIGDGFMAPSGVPIRAPVGVDAARYVTVHRQLPL